MKFLIMQFLSAYDFLSVFRPNKVNFSRIAAASKIKLNEWINVLYRTPLEDSYSAFHFNFLKISVRKAALQPSQLTCP
jgi:hypothetical protein